MDFLGLRNLTIIADAVKAIKANRDTDIDLLGLKLDDKPTYELLAAATRWACSSSTAGRCGRCCG